VTLVGFLGLGEAGSLIAADLAEAGVTVRGWDPLVSEARWLEGADAAAFDHLVEGSRKHAVRRRAEMEAAVATLEQLGVAPRVSAASEAWLAELAA
jgi:prephenate dehydrogenase